MLPRALESFCRAGGGRLSFLPIRPSRASTSHIITPSKLLNHSTVINWPPVAPLCGFCSIHRASRGHSPLNAQPSKECCVPPSFGLRARPPSSLPCEQVIVPSARPSSMVTFVANTSRLAKPTLFQTRRWRISSRDGTRCHLRSRPTCGWPFETE